MASETMIEKKKTPDNPQLPIRRRALPISSAGSILPGQVVPIRAHLHEAGYRGTRLVIQHPERWSIRGIRRVNVTHKKASSEEIAGEIPGTAFAASARDPVVDFGRPFDIGEDLVVDVAYTGGSEAGERLWACVTCTDQPADLHVDPTTGEDRGQIQTGQIHMASDRPIKPMEEFRLRTAGPSQLWDRLKDGLWPEQIVLDVENAADWAVNDIRLHGKSLLLQSGDLPGIMFAWHPGSPPLEIDHLTRSGDDLEVVATYLGPNPDGAVLQVRLSGPLHAADRSPNRLWLLPMSGPLNLEIATGTTAQITARPQDDRRIIPAGHGLRARRIVLDHPDDWVIHDFKIGNASELLGSGDVPGAAFAADQAPDLICARPAYPGMDVVLQASHVNGARSGGRFLCGIMGDLVPSPR
jgi:hypothetical protein